MSANGPDLKHIFKQIDTDNDGYISRANIEETEYTVVFGHNHATLNAISSAHDGKINLQDFQLLYHAHSLTKQVPNVIQAVITKFEAAKFLDKYKSVSAPGAAGPNEKQSFIKLTAKSGDHTKHQHSVGIEFGVDKPLQQQEIKKIQQALGHKPHEVFFLLKFRCKSAAKGVHIAQTLEKVVYQVIDTLKQLAPEMQSLFNLIKVHAKYSNEYVYLVAEVDNPFVDAIIAFFNEIIQSLSPECRLKFKVKLTSALGNLLKEDFNYEKSSGEIALELDVDSVTLHKLRQIIGDNLVNETENQPMNVLLSLLFEEIKLSAEFTNLGEALSSTFNQDVSSFPKPYDSVATIKNLGIKQIAGQLLPQSTDLIANLKEHCRFEGELSLNLHDIYVKLSFDLDIEQAFDLL